MVEDLVIEGLTPQDRPFLTAKTITVEVPWWTIFSKKLIVESVEMTDWDMVVETYANGRHNFPKFTRKTPSKGPSRFTTTLRSVVALRGGVHLRRPRDAVDDLGAQPERQRLSPAGRDNYIGPRRFSNGTVKIQSYEPFRTDMQSRFSIDNGMVHFDHMDLSSDGVALGGHRRRRPRALAGADLPRHVEDRLPDAEGHLLPRPELHRLRAGGLRRHVPPVQGRRAS